MILAAGLGTRLRPLTYVMPKPVAPVLNRPIVAWIAELLASHGFKQVVTNVSYLPEQIGEVLGVTESRVSQLHTKAILRLKAHLSGAQREPAET